MPTLTDGAPLRIIFAGTPDFAVVPLRALARKGFLPIAAMSQPDRRAGRGLKLQASPVKQAAEQLGIPLHQPASLKTSEFLHWLNALHADLMIVVAYGLILPQAVLDAPRFGCWNIHASLLPRWRGAAPIQRAIEAGDSHSGICIMQMDAGLDTGAVLARESCALAMDETAGSLHDKLAELGANSLIQCLHSLQTGHPPVAVPQPGAGITYAPKLEKAEAEINWQESAQQLERRIRAFNPWPVCWCDVAGERTRIWQASAEGLSRAAEAGEVIASSANGIVVACGSGQLRITQLQRAGGKPQMAQEYLQGRGMPDRLSP